MPRGNGTGPAGQGPLTGRGNGRCAGNDVGYGNEFHGRSFGLGRGIWRGSGFGQGYPANQTPYNTTSEKSRIENAIHNLKNELDVLEKRRNEIKGK